MEALQIAAIFQSYYSDFFLYLLVREYGVQVEHYFLV